MFAKFKTKNRFAFTVLTLLMLAFSAFHAKAQDQEKLSSLLLITVEAKGCLGTCPIYSAQIYSDGTVIYEGKEYVKFTGTKQYKISENKITKLIEEFKRIKFLSLEEVYDTGELELPAFITIVSLDGKQKKVTNYSGAPKELNELEIKVLRDTNLFDFVGPL